MKATIESHKPAYSVSTMQKVVYLGVYRTSREVLIPQKRNKERGLVLSMPGFCTARAVALWGKTEVLKKLQRVLFAILKIKCQGQITQFSLRPNLAHYSRKLC